MKIEATRPLLGDYFRLHAKWRGAKSALVADGQTLNWRQFNGRLNRVANMVHAAGLSVGDRVIVFMDNGADMAEVLFGLIKAGVASAPLNLSVSDAAVAVMIRDSGARTVFASRIYIARLDKIIMDMGEDAPSLLIASGQDDGAEPSALPWSDFVALRNAQSDNEPDGHVRPDDILNIIYSSGTTGQPKGIVHTQQSRLDWAYDLAAALRYDGQSRMLATIGLYSNITWVGMLSVLLRGGCLIVAPRFDAASCWQAINAQRVTHIAMVPILYQRLADHEASYKIDTSHVRNLMSAGSPLRPELREALFDIFPCGITELYGLTEGVITTLDPEDADGRMASAGLPLPGSDLMILDDRDQPCAPGQSGEILMASRFVMPGYLNRPDETEAARYVDENGQHWLRTGDIGQLDTDGYLYVVDRKKDMILSGGQNIYPQDIEAVLARHDNVADVAVIGVPSRKWGETPLVLVVARNGSIDPKSLKDWTNAQLGRQQRIADIKLVTEIPRNPNGKVLKRQLREDFKGLDYD
ncbi:MAG: class I adenylate-forming enzyme family protein [Litorimonas sp.]